jgi:hypothetical protein
MFEQSINRRDVLWRFGVGTLAVAVAVPAVAADRPPIAAYRNPGCGCCGKWAESLRQAGFTVTMEDDPALDERRTKLGVPAELAGCHTATVNDYVIEGHVPAEDIVSFLAKKPEARGLAVPGMPVGSPGMESGEPADSYEVFMFTADGKSEIYARH